MNFHHLFFAGVVLVLVVIIYSLYKKKNIFELGQFATIAILLLALPRLLYLLYFLISLNPIEIDDFRIEFSLGVALLLIRCIQEIANKLRNL